MPEPRKGETEIMPATPEQVRHTLQEYIRAWTEKDKALLLSLFAEDGIMEDPVGTPPFKGHEGIGKFWDFALQGPEREIMPRLEEIRACGGEGILRFTMEVRLPETREGLNLSIIEHVEFRDDGRIARIRAFWDENAISAPPGWKLFAPNISEAYEA